MSNLLIDHFRENAVLWMLILFVGVLFWGFRARIKARRLQDQAPKDDGL
jgi:cbb3-type cytochrome oxidase subunit 3